MYEDICYKKNNITEVICRLDFANPVDLFDTTMPKGVYNAIRKYYPIAEPQEIVGNMLQVNPVTGPTVNNIMRKQWVFWSRDRKSNCWIDSMSIVFSLKRYVVFENVRNAVSDIMKTILTLDEKYQGKRLGLRYINTLPMHTHENWIGKQFYNAFAAHKDNQTIRLITELEYVALDKDLRVKLQYGYLNPDYPAVMKNEVFTIDIDAFSQGLIYKDDVETMIDNMHSEVQSCFEKMITDDYRSELNKEESINE